MTEVVRFDGAPGAGKTHNLRLALSREKDHGLRPGRFYWLTFSKTGASDITGDIRETFPDADDVHQRASTIHGLALSLCYRNGVIDAPPEADPIISQDTDSDVYGAFCRRQGMSYDPDYNDPTKILRGSHDVAHNGNLFFAVNDYLRQTCKPATDYRHAPVTLPISRGRVTALLGEWDAFKRGYRDYRLFEHGDYVNAAFKYQCVPDIDVLLVDEFQDLAPIEYRLYKLWRDAGSIDTIYIAGDAGQSIYSFRGGTPHYFEETDADDTTLLKTSYRCKSAIAEQANALLDLHPGTDPRGFAGSDNGGTVTWPRLTDPYTLRDAIIESAETYTKDTPSVFLLTRTRRQLGKLINDLKTVGIPFEVLGRNNHVYTPDMRQWLAFLSNYQSDGQTFAAPNLNAVIRTYPDADDRRDRRPSNALGFYNRGEVDTVFHDKPTANAILDGMAIESWQYDILDAALEAPAALSPADINVGTIHRAKGLEAASVYLFTETTRKQVKRYNRNEDTAAEEHRIYYVGSTRAADELRFVRGYFNGPEAPPLQQLRVHSGVAANAVPARS